jgi:hypothetical protein
MVQQILEGVKKREKKKETGDFLFKNHMKQK